MNISGFITGGGKYSAGVFLFILAACVTINIYFPAAEVQKAAQQIVKDVRGKDAAGLDGQQPNSATETPAEKPVSSISFSNLAWASGELTVSNASIRSLKNRIKENYPLLRKWFIQGVLGEGADGYVVLRSESGISLRDKMEARRVMNEENTNRRALYRAVASALNVPESEVARVGHIFARQWQSSVPAGTWIETSPGKWTRR